MNALGYHNLGNIDQTLHHKSNLASEQQRTSFVKQIPAPPSYIISFGNVSYTHEKSSHNGDD